MDGAVLVDGGGWGRTGGVGGGAGLVGAGGWEEFCIHIGCAARPTNTTRSRSRSVLWGRDKRWGEGQCLLGGARPGAGLVGVGGWEESFASLCEAATTVHDWYSLLLV